MTKTKKSEQKKWWDASQETQKDSKYTRPSSTPGTHTHVRVEHDSVSHSQMGRDSSLSMPGIGEDVQQWGLSHAITWKGTLVSWEQSGNIWQRGQAACLDSAILLWGIYPTEFLGPVPEEFYAKTSVQHCLQYWGLGNILNVYPKLRGTRMVLYSNSRILYSSEKDCMWAVWMSMRFSNKTLRRKN